SPARTEADALFPDPVGFRDLRYVLGRGLDPVALGTKHLAVLQRRFAAKAVSEYVVVLRHADDLQVALLAVAAAALPCRELDGFPELAAHQAALLSCSSTCWM